ncbi:MAG: hypothetical protein EHM46_05485 [Bacteroidetes bacterium]|nr:MAG: hypothetical protein EHM46_05485 [Bacteroidota bacterium]
MAGIAEKIGRRILRNKLKGFNREVRVYNFETARSAAILFNSSEAECFQVIRAFGKFLEKQGIRTKVFGYVPQKEIPQEMLFWKDYIFITRKDLTWYMQPRGEGAESFYSQDIDLLIDFTRNVLLELQFLVRLSTARFKVGCFTEDENDYDLMINMTGQCDIRFFAEQVRHYIGMLNPTN